MFWWFQKGDLSLELLEKEFILLLAQDPVDHTTEAFPLLKN